MAGAFGARPPVPRAWAAIRTPGAPLVRDRRARRIRRGPSEEPAEACVGGSHRQPTSAPSGQRDTPMSGACFPFGGSPAQRRAERAPNPLRRNRGLRARTRKRSAPAIGRAGAGGDRRGGRTRQSPARAPTNACLSPRSASLRKIFRAIFAGANGPRSSLRDTCWPCPEIHRSPERTLFQYVIGYRVVLRPVPRLARTSRHAGKTFFADFRRNGAIPSPKGQVLHSPQARTI